MSPRHDLCQIVAPWPPGSSRRRFYESAGVRPRIPAACADCGTEVNECNGDVTPTMFDEGGAQILATPNLTALLLRRVRFAFTWSFWFRRRSKRRCPQVFSCVLVDVSRIGERFMRCAVCPDYTVTRGQAALA